MNTTNKTRKLLISVLLLFCTIAIFAQSQSVWSYTKQYTIVQNSDTIDFLRISNLSDNEPKPTILFCLGSLPIPLISLTGKETYFSCINWDYQTNLDKYNLIVISMPHTPIEIDTKELNDQGAYTPNLDSSAYHNDDYLANYVRRGNAVLDFLRKQTWVDTTRIIIFGHSQGSYIASHLAEQNPDIYAVGYFSGDVLGRYSSIILQERNEAKRGKISQEEAQANIEKRYEWWREVCRNPVDFPAKEGNSKRTWKSFTISDVDLLTNLKMPVYIVYGTEDDGPQMCDILPIFFELKGKTNYKMRPFVGCGHNFEEITPDGKHHFDKMHWKEAMSEVISWCASSNVQR
jgi:pimeloyl-ACP methyl ester carboxylesterase